MKYIIGRALFGSVELSDAARCEDVHRARLGKGGKFVEKFVEKFCFLLFGLVFLEFFFCQPARSLDLGIALGSCIQRPSQEKKQHQQRKLGFDSHCKLLDRE